MTEEIIKLIATFVGGGGFFVAVIAGVLKYQDSRATARESGQTKYYGDIGSRLVQLEEDVRDQLTQIIELSREVSNLDADNRILKSTVKRLRAQRDNLLRLAKRLGAKFDDVGVAEVSSDLVHEIALADEATSVVEDT